MVPTPTPTDTPDAVHAERLLFAAPRRDITHLLVPEPDELIAALLLQQEWPWQDTLLSHLAAPRRARVLQAMHWAGGHTRRRRRRAVDTALVDTAARRLTRRLAGARAGGGGPSGQAPSGVSLSLRRWAVRTAARLAGRVGR